jgi:hypothetical protein
MQDHAKLAILLDQARMALEPRPGYRARPAWCIEALRELVDLLERHREDVTQAIAGRLHELDDPEAGLLLQLRIDMAAGFYRKAYNRLLSDSDGYLSADAPMPAPMDLAPAEGIRHRLEYLRGEIRAERISYMELNELQGLAQYIEPGDVELLGAAGVPEEVQP